MPHKRSYSLFQWRPRISFASRGLKPSSTKTGSDLGATSVVEDSESRGHRQIEACGLLSLPRSVRRKIWAYVLTSPEDLLPQGVPHHHKRLIRGMQATQLNSVPSDVPNNSVSILRVCRRVKQEALGVLMYDITWTIRDPTRNPYTLFSSNGIIPAKILAHVQRIELHHEVVWKTYWAQNHPRQNDWWHQRKMDVLGRLHQNVVTHHRQLEYIHVVLNIVFESQTALFLYEMEAHRELLRALQPLGPVKHFHLSATQTPQIHHRHSTDSKLCNKSRPPPFRLLDLPLDIRELVYFWTLHPIILTAKHNQAPPFLEQPHILPIIRHRKPYGTITDQYFTIVHSQILRANRQIHAEASYILLTRFPVCFPYLENISCFLIDCPPVRARQLRSIAITLRLAIFQRATWRESWWWWEQREVLHGHWFNLAWRLGGLVKVTVIVDVRWTTGIQGQHMYSQDRMFDKAVGLLSLFGERKFEVVNGTDIVERRTYRDVGCNGVSDTAREMVSSLVNELKAWAREQK